MVAPADLTAPVEALMGDRIVLTIPSDPRFRNVATLVLGGIGSRAELPYERTDDLQLAVLSALDASSSDDVTVEVDTDDGRLEVALGPVREGSGGDPALARVLSRLVDEVSSQHRDGGEWLTLVLQARAREQLDLGRDLLDEAAGRFGPRGPGDVGLCQDSDKLSAGDDRQAPDLLGRHPLKCVVERLLGLGDHRILGAHVRNGDLVRIEVLRDYVEHEVAVRHHPDERLAIDDRKRADVIRQHPACRLDNHRVARDRGRPLCHNVLHGSCRHLSPLFE